jgi:NAD(P)H-quinone oxidoreductase subunit 5
MIAFTVLGLIVVAVPALLVAVLGLTSLVGHPLSESRTSQIVKSAMFTGLIASIAILALMLIRNERRVPIELGHWVVLHDHEDGSEPIDVRSEAPYTARPLPAPPSHPLYHFSFKFEFDRLSVPFVILTFVLCGTIGAFADKYMHREAGFNRFFVLYAIFVMGMVVTSLAGTIETMFAGWEMVGLSSTLLVAFFQERPNPCRNGLRVWVVYRLSDAGLLSAAILLHHVVGEGDFDRLMGAGPWPEGVAALTSGQALTVGLLLLFAVAGKSALIPFSGWLPRAMEGPTPSSAVFYGALSVHLGAFLLLRVSPILALSPVLAAIVVLLGLSTALYASFSVGVQTDIKSALSFASLTQVGFIVAEIGLFAWIGPWAGMPWLQYIPLIHMIGHGCLRTLQFLRAPTLLHDYRVLENAFGGSLTIVPPSGDDRAVRPRLYRLAMNRGNLDALLVRYLVEPVLAMFRGFDQFERRWINRINRKTSEFE